MSQIRNHILIVDDEAVSLAILQAIFEDAGYLVTTACDVPTAQKILAEHLNDVDLVLSDIQMPGKTGFDLLRWMKANGTKEIPILLITSHLPEPEHRIFGLALGAIDYVARSLESEELVLRVKRAIENFVQLRSLRTSLESSENLASMGRMFAASNHEIKNLAMIIQVSAGMLGRLIGGDLPTDAVTTQRSLSALIDSANLLASITKSIDGLINEKSITIAPIDVSALTTKVVQIVQPVFKGIYVDALLGREPIWAQGNAIHFQQLMINLLLNAREAIHEAAPMSGGRIGVSIEQRHEAIVLEVVDNGVGLPCHEVRNDFPAFSTTRQLRGGKGLGLWLCNRFVQAMEGKLELASLGPGQGATGRITLKQAVSPKTAELNVARYMAADVPAH